MSWLRAWVGLWDRREPATSLALVRILIAAVLMIDLLIVGYHDLPGWFWADTEFGGLWQLSGRDSVPPIARLVSVTPAVGWGLWFTLIGSLAMFGGGVFTRFSGLVFLLTYAQTAWINNASDRGIDRMARIVILLLIFSRSGDALGFDAWRRTGRWLGDGRLVPSWPRYLIVLQITCMYWFAGVAKFAVSWFPWGDYAALYIILQDPIFTTSSFEWLGHPWLFPLTQIGTAGSHMWEWTFPLMLLAFHYRDTRTRKGRLRALFNRCDVRLAYVLVGVVFHLGLAATMRLGIFPYAMLAFYPVFFHPDEIARFAKRLKLMRPR